MKKQQIIPYCQRTGQAVSQNPSEIIRCCLESLALKYRVGVEQLEQLLGYHLATIWVVGGGSQNELLCQFTADACAREVVARPIEATSWGNLVFQAIATGYITGYIMDIATGRKALESSVPLKHYLPGENKGWDSVLDFFIHLTRTV